MAEALGNRIVYGSKVEGIDFLTNTIRANDGQCYSADVIVSTIPWKEFSEINGMPESIKNSIKSLKHSSIQVEYFPEKLDTDSQWIYYPDDSLTYHRVLVRHNFCPNSKGYWTETNSERIETSGRECQFTYLNQYAYPLNTVDKPKIMSELLKWCEERGVYGLGRWGEHCHYNSDVTVELALNRADYFLSKE